MAPQLRPSKPADKQPKIDWSRRQEAENFAETVKLFRQGKIDPDMFRRFRLQHGAYGTRMTDDYAMVRIKVPAGQIYPYKLEKIAREIGKELRCLVCQNEDIQNSNADIAKDLRKIVRKKLSEGETKEQIITFIHSKYGDFVLFAVFYGLFDVVVYVYAYVCISSCFLMG